MVKVLENKLVDLDLMPGQEQIDLKRKFREQMKTGQATIGDSDEGKEIELPEGARIVQGEEGARLANQQGLQVPKEILSDSLSAEQKQRASGFGGVIIDSGGKVISGLTGTVGGVLKGVGDTAGNAVFGLGKTGTGLVTGLADTAKAPFAASNTAAIQQVGAPSTGAQEDGDASASAQDGQSLSGSQEESTKIELRGDGGLSDGEPEDA
ncbi:uncharacterized protein PV09_02499 [Verruconis gallopava]|uniref:Uncharacterized protein n=1 Tax=Verruconis gallopava TaxID=253628 RepID=A0A0D2B6F4_9PEZI|nr:uncharacterized protein PV09_02499 [Verruconis gallopava]KIW06819.1 hypothetical protein PV09_02499 [Verruconis gallopava]